MSDLHEAMGAAIQAAQDIEACAWLLLELVGLRIHERDDLRGDLVVEFVPALLGLWRATLGAGFEEVLGRGGECALLASVLPRAQGES